MRDDAERGSKDAVEITILHERLGRGRKWLEEQGAAHRARVEEQRRAVQETVEGMRRPTIH